MTRRILSSLRAQWAGFLALFLVLTTGSAYAVAGHNTIFSDDITNGEVTTSDLAQGAVTPGRLHADAVDSSKVLDHTLTENDIAAESLSGESLRMNSVGAREINEGLLGTVPVAFQGGIGGYASTGSCDPETLTFVDCSSVALQLGRPGRVLIIAQVIAEREPDHDGGYWGNCRLRVDEQIIHSSTTPVRVNGGDHEPTHLTLTAVSEPVAKGKRGVHVECNALPLHGAIVYSFARLSAVGLSTY